MKVDLRRIIKKISKFPHSRSASLRFALRDCGNRTHLPNDKCVLFEISFADIALSIGFFYKLPPPTGGGTDRNYNPPAFHRTPYKSAQHKSAAGKCHANLCATTRQ